MKIHSSFKRVGFPKVINRSLFITFGKLKDFYIIYYSRARAREFELVSNLNNSDMRRREVNLKRIYACRLRLTASATNRQLPICLRQNSRKSKVIIDIR